MNSTNRVFKDYDSVNVARNRRQGSRLRHLSPGRRSPGWTVRDVNREISPARAVEKIQRGEWTPSASRGVSTCPFLHVDRERIDSDDDSPLVRSSSTGSKGPESSPGRVSRHTIGATRRMIRSSPGNGSPHIITRTLIFSIACENNLGNMFGLWCSRNHRRSAQSQETDVPW